MGRETFPAVQRPIVVFVPGSNTERPFCFWKKAFYNNLILRKYIISMYLNTSISIAPQQTDKELASNGTIIYPIKNLHWATGLLD